MRTWKSVGVLLAAALTAMLAAADDDANERAREEMQRALNKEVMATPFNPGDAKKALAYAELAKQQNVAPVAQPPAYWIPGWTCANLTTSTNCVLIWLCRPARRQTCTR